jgi:dihydroorotase
MPGVKSYPRGVTTNSDSGIESYEVYYDVFREMEKVGLVLNLHGEIPSDAGKARICMHWSVCGWLAARKKKK